MVALGIILLVLGFLVLLFNIIIGLLFMILGAIFLGIGLSRSGSKSKPTRADHLVAARDRISPQEALRRRLAADSDRVPCPHCAEMTLRAAKVCRYCGRDVPLELDRRVS